MTPEYKKLMKLFYQLEGVSSDSTHHPEENILTHSLQAFKLARRESDDKELWIAALFHDIGKIVEPKGHEKESVNLLKDHGYYNAKVFSIIDNHMRMRLYLDGSMRKWGKIQTLVNNPWFKETTMLRRYDHMGRVPDKKVYDIAEVALDLLEKTNRPCSVCADISCPETGGFDGYICEHFTMEETKCSEE